MRKCCSSILILAVILLCIGCPNTSDNIENKIPTEDVEVPSVDTKPVNDSMASPAEVLRNLNNKPNYFNSSKESYIPRYVIGEGEDIDVTAQSYNLTNQPNMSKMFQIVFTYDIAPQMEGMDFDTFETGYVFNPEMIFSEETVNYIAARVCDNYDYAREVLSQISISNVKVVKESEIEATVYYLLTVQKNQKYYCVLKCIKNEFFDDVFDTEFIAFDIAEGELILNPCNIISSKTEYKEEKMLSYNLLTQCKFENEIWNYDTILQQDKIEEDALGTKISLIQTKDTGWERKVFSFISSLDKHGYGIYQSNNEDIMEIYGQNAKLYYIGRKDENKVKHYLNSKSCPDYASDEKITMEEFKGLYIPIDSINRVELVAKNCINTDLILEQESGLSKTYEVYSTDEFNQNFKYDHTYLTNTSIEELKKWCEKLMIKD